MSAPSVLPHDPSWWFADAMRLEGEAAPALTGEITADVAIVGGGYTGLWTALALKAEAQAAEPSAVEIHFAHSCP